jgi:hypothetical protein
MGGEMKLADQPYISGTISKHIGGALDDMALFDPKAASLLETYMCMKIKSVQALRMENEHLKRQLNSKGHR